MKRNFNRRGTVEIISHSAGPTKAAELVYKALSSVNCDLNSIQMFHNDRGGELKNKLIDEALEKRSLSMNECPYDNAMAESMFNIIKTEFTNQAHFSSLDQLVLELNEYISWYN